MNTATNHHGTQQGFQAEQIQDDLPLLELMMADLRSAPNLYRPGNYWERYEKYILPELRRYGLRDFRRRRQTLLGTLGATDYAPQTEIVATRPDTPALSARVALLRLAIAIPWLARNLSSLGSAMVGSSWADLSYLLYSYAKWYGAAANARPIESLSVSMAGNPEGVFRVGENLYTKGMIHYYLYYAYCCRYVDFQAIRTVMEVGSGMGKQVEVLRKLHPHLCFYLFDIPPQLYICQQYLTMVFPGSVVGYRDVRDFPPPEAGKIFILPTWKLPEIQHPAWDMHWNCASYQEMEAEQTCNYLSFVNRWSRKCVFLMEKMDGMQHAQRPGEHGVLSPTRLEHYQNALPDFDLLDMSKTADVTMFRYGSCTFWKRKSAVPLEAPNAG